MSDYMAGTQHRLKRGRTSDLWAPLNVEALRSNPEYGFFKEYDFVDVVNDLAAWTVDDSTSTVGSATAAAIAGDLGVLRLDTAAATDEHGIQLVHGSATSAAFTPTANSVMAMEMLCKWSTIGTFPLFAFGFGTVNQFTWTTSTDALTPTNFVGLTSVTGGASLVIPTSKVSGSTTVGSTVHTMVDGSWVKVGFRITGTSLLETWINGIKLSSSYNLTVLPAAAMTPRIAHQSRGTVRPLLDIDLVSIGWAYSPNIITA